MSSKHVSFLMVRESICPNYGSAKYWIIVPKVMSCIFGPVFTLCSFSPLFLVFSQVRLIQVRNCVLDYPLYELIIIILKNKDDLILEISLYSNHLISRLFKNCHELKRHQNITNTKYLLFGLIKFLVI